MAKYKFIPFSFPIIMAGKEYPSAVDELSRQIAMLLEMDSGMAQPCHCEFHDPAQCRADRLEDERERETLAQSIKKALML